MATKKPAWLTTQQQSSSLPVYEIPKINRNRIAVGFDTETTGLVPPRYDPVTGLRYPDPDHRYCYPYIVCAVYYKQRKLGSQIKTRVELSWEFRIDPATRQPLPFDDDELTQLDEIYELLTNPDVLLVGHNIPFDLQMTYALFSLVKPSIRKSRYPKMTPDLIRHILLYQCDDTTTMFHAIDSDQHLELKPLATRWAGIPDTDEQDLKIAVDKARKLIQQSCLPINIASLKSLPYLSKAPKRGWYILDSWLGHIDTSDCPDELALLSSQIRSLVVEYCTMDCWRTLSLHSVALEMFENPPSNHKSLLSQYESNRIASFATHFLDNTGVSIHEDFLASHILTLQTHITSLSKTIKAIATKHTLSPRDYRSPSEYATAKFTFQFNPNSDQQLATLIHDKLDVPCSKFTESGNPSMKIDNMVELLSIPDLNPDARTVISSVIALKKYEKALSMENSYLIKQVGKRLYASYNPNGTGTLRLSSSDPNGQNIGKGQVSKTIAELVTESVSLRPIFGPKKGREWYSVDYVQLQLVIFAIVTGDPEMRKAVDEQRDIHDFMARKIFNTPSTSSPTDGERRIAKAVNFGYIFGAGERKVEATAKIKGLFDLLRMLFPTASNTIAHNKRTAERDGYVLTHGGYPLKVPREKPHAATNYVIQGTEGEIVKYALYCCIRYLLEYCLEAFLTITVHDELVFDFPHGKGHEHMPKLIQYMVLAGSRLEPPIPLRVDVKYIDQGKGWNEGVLVEL